MRKVSVVVSALVFSIGLVGSASAISFTDTTDLGGVKLAEGPIADLFTQSSHTYSHNTPGDFEVPFDVVNSATLDIYAYWVNGNNDTVEVMGSAVGVLESGGAYSDGHWKLTWRGWKWVDGYDSPSVTSLDIAPIFSTWETGAPFSVTIDANGCFFDGNLTLKESIFEMDYENGMAPVPEPGTILLLGTGLVGLAGYGRKRKMS